MTIPGNMDSDTGTWIFRGVLLGLAFLLGLDVREAKKNLAAVPGLITTTDRLQEMVDKLEERIRDLEKGH